MKQRVVIKIYGQVQGTNLRSMIKIRALSSGLTGYVSNLEDGSVRIELEGEKYSLESFLRWINTHPGNAKIDKLEDYWSEAQNRFSNFEIR